MKSKKHLEYNKTESTALNFRDLYLVSPTIDYLASGFSKHVRTESLCNYMKEIQMELKLADIGSPIWKFLSYAHIGQHSEVKSLKSIFVYITCQNYGYPFL